MSRLEVTGKTRVLGVIGHPVEHSLSPLLQNHVIELLGLDYCYVAFPVAPLHAPNLAASMRTLGLQGLNVTIPHKETVLWGFFACRTPDT